MRLLNKSFLVKKLRKFIRRLVMEFFFLALTLGGGWLLLSLSVVLDFEGIGGESFLGVEALEGSKQGKGVSERWGVWSWEI